MTKLFEVLFFISIVVFITLYVGMSIITGSWLNPVFISSALGSVIIALLTYRVHYHGWESPFIEGLLWLVGVIGMAITLFAVVIVTMIGSSKSSTSRVAINLGDMAFTGLVASIITGPWIFS